MTKIGINYITELSEVFIHAFLLPLFHSILREKKLSILEPSPFRFIHPAFLQALSLTKPEMSDKLRNESQKNTGKKGVLPFPFYLITTITASKLQL